MAERLFGVLEAQLTDRGLALDQESNVLRRLKLTAGKCHETQMFSRMLLGDEAAVFADKAYLKKRLVLQSG